MSVLLWLLALPVVAILVFICIAVVLILQLKSVLDFFQFNPMTWFTFDELVKKTRQRPMTMALILSALTEKTRVETRLRSDLELDEEEMKIAQNRIDTEGPPTSARVVLIRAKLLEYRYVRSGRRRPSLSDLLKAAAHRWTPEPAGKTA